MLCDFCKGDLPKDKHLVLFSYDIEYCIIKVSEQSFRGNDRFMKGNVKKELTKHFEERLRRQLTKEEKAFVLWVVERSTEEKEMTVQIAYE